MGDMSKVATVAVCHQVPLQYVGATGETFTIDAEFRYHPNDPYAVSAILRTAGQEVTWTFARDLLGEGRYEPTGEGDVHVWPCLSSSGTAVVVVELTSPDGGILVQADSRLIDDFVRATLDVVPAGSEAVDLDGVLATLLA